MPSLFILSIFHMDMEKLAVLCYTIMKCLELGEEGTGTYV